MSLTWTIETNTAPQADQTETPPEPPAPVVAPNTRDLLYVALHQSTNDKGAIVTRTLSELQTRLRDVPGAYKAVHNATVTCYCVRQADDPQPVVEHILKNGRVISVVDGFERLSVLSAVRRDADPEVPLEPSPVSPTCPASPASPTNPTNPTKEVI